VPHPKHRASPGTFAPRSDPSHASDTHPFLTNVPLVAISAPSRIPRAARAKPPQRRPSRLLPAPPPPPTARPFSPPPRPRAARSSPALLHLRGPRPAPAPRRTSTATCSNHRSSSCTTATGRPGRCSSRRPSRRPTPPQLITVAGRPTLSSPSPATTSPKSPARSVHSSLTCIVLESLPIVLRSPKGNVV